MLIADHPSLSDLIAGTVVSPVDEGWDAARTGFNLALDQSPVAVAYPDDEQDVVTIVRHARSRGLRIAPQATGHNPGPLGDMSDVLLVNVERLDEVRIDAAARRVRVGAGVRWRDVVPQLSELGLAALHGSSPDVGIAGYSLGGGMGWMARKHGLQANAVTAMELVTAEGALVRAEPTRNPELFWALRGGGGNFGVVTAIEFAVHPVEEFYAGQLFFPMERAREVLQAWNAMLPALPEELMTWAALLRFPEDPAVPEPVRGGEFAVVFAAFEGQEAEGCALLEPVRALGAAIDTFAMVPPEGLADLAMDPRDPLPAHTAHQLLGELPPAVIDDLVAATGPGSGSPLAMVQLRYLGGALARVAPGAGARATLPGHLSFFAIAVTPDEAATAAGRNALLAAEATVIAHRAGDYPNFVETPADASAFFDEATWRRLREVKALYDPEDLFRGNHHVPPAEAQ